MFNLIKSAFNSIFTNKTRSILATLGVIIGVSAVTILVSLGNGLKKSASNMIRGLGTNIITITSGKVDAKDNNPAQFLSTDILKTDDLKTLEKIQGIEAFSPISLVEGNLKNKDETASPFILGVSPNFLQIMQNLKIARGKMFDNRANNYAIVLSEKARETLFGKDEALEKKIKLQSHDFLVLGILAQSDSNSIFGSDYDNAALLPYETAKTLNKGSEKIFRIIVKVKPNTNINQVKKNIHDELLKNHKNEENFSVLTQDDLLSFFNQFLSLAASFIAAIAAVSLVVGGIGIMNIMLVTVTERTKEIGLRKAIGATSLAIATQFLIEAIIITLLGGLIGILISLLINRIIASNTPIIPQLDLKTILLSLGISIVVGIIFGLWPALNAAKKEPAEALKYE